MENPLYYPKSPETGGSSFYSGYFIISILFILFYSVIGDSEILFIQEIFRKRPCRYIIEAYSNNLITEIQLQLLATFYCFKEVPLIYLMGVQNGKKTKRKNK